MFSRRKTLSFRIGKPTISKIFSHYYSIIFILLSDLLRLINMSNKYVLSTMTNSIYYCDYQKNKSGIPFLRKKVLIHGGASIPSSKSGFGDMSYDNEGRPIWTASGVITVVSESDYEFLLKNKVFNEHLEQNLIKVINHDITGSQREINKLTNTMEKDGFRQLTPQTVKAKINDKLKISTYDRNPNGNRL